MQKKVKALLTDSLKSAKAIKWAQEAIEKMQIAIAKGDAEVIAFVAKAAKALKAARDRETEARKLKIELSSHYQPVYDLYMRDLKDATAENISLALYQSSAIQRVVKHANKGQEVIIAKYCDLKSQQSMFEIMAIGEFLEAKGFKVKPAKEDKAKDDQAAAKKPVEVVE